MNYKIEILRNLYRERHNHSSFRNNLNLTEKEKICFQSLNKNGIYIWKNFMNQNLCYDIKCSIDSFYEKHSFSFDKIFSEISSQKLKWGVNYNNYNIWIDKEKSDFRIIKSENINSNINDFKNNESLHRIGSRFLNKNLNCFFTMANKTTYQNNNKGSGGGWHRDRTYANSYKTLLYLNDVTNENGPFQYLKKSFSIKNHLLSVDKLDKNQFDNFEIEKMSKKYFVETVIANAGDLVLFNPNGIHRGKPINKGSRYAITNYYD